ncbi:hypothetical protein HBB16_19510 [Pseudonocardia sp. MCCB 268]|nr:hypothetical protein [Pseudonocardia cytotoxica]
MGDLIHEALLHVAGKVGTSVRTAWRNRCARSTGPSSSISSPRPGMWARRPRPGGAGRVPALRFGSGPCTTSPASSGELPMTDPAQRGLRESATFDRATIVASSTPRRPVCTTSAVGAPSVPGRTSTTCCSSGVSRPGTRLEGYRGAPGHDVVLGDRYTRAPCRT